MLIVTPKRFLSSYAAGTLRFLASLRSPVPVLHVHEESSAVCLNSRFPGEYSRPRTYEVVIMATTPRGANTYFVDSLVC